MSGSVLDLQPGVAEAGGHTLQERVHALSFLVFSTFSLTNSGELHPARNPWIGAAIDEECGEAMMYYLRSLHRIDDPHATHIIGCFRF